jgi:hypothetical protein
MLGPFPHTETAWSALLVRAGREVGRLSRDARGIRFTSPDTGLTVGFVRDARGLWIDLPLPAPRGAAVEVGEVVEAWPRSMHPSLPDGAPWSVAGFVAVFEPPARAALGGRPLLVADDAPVEAAWAWNRAHWERAALYDELFVATAWLVRVSDRVTTAAPWTRALSTLAPPAEWVLVVGDARDGVAVSALRMEVLLPLAEEVDGGRVLAVTDARWEAALATAVDARGIVRLPLLGVVERSLAAGGC